MDQSTQTKTTKSRTGAAANVGLRVKRETKKRIQAELAKINKKDFGKRVRCDELIGTALSLLTEQHLKALRDASMTNSDRLELRFREFTKSNPDVSKDQYLGMLLSGELRV